TRRLKNDPRTQHIPIVALTGHALAGHAEGAREAGCDAFVTKPCLPDALVAEIKRLLELHAANAEHLKDGGRCAKASKKRSCPVGATQRAKTAKKPAKKAAPARKAAPAAARKVIDRAAGETPRQDAARGKLERVKVPSQSRREDGMEGKYVYCVIRSEQPLSFGPLGLGPEPAEVHTIHFRDIAAVVSNTPIVVQDPTRENVLAHQRVNETVMQKHTVIPMSFGTVFKTDDAIIAL